MEVISEDGLVVCARQIDDQPSLLVSDLVTLARFDGHVATGETGGEQFAFISPILFRGCGANFQ